MHLIFLCCTSFFANGIPSWSLSNYTRVPPPPPPPKKKKKNPILILQAPVPLLNRNIGVGMVTSSIPLWSLDKYTARTPQTLSSNYEGPQIVCPSLVPCCCPFHPRNIGRGPGWCCLSESEVSIVLGLGALKCLAVVGFRVSGGGFRWFSGLSQMGIYHLAASPGNAESEAPCRLKAQDPTT